MKRENDVARRNPDPEIRRRAGDGEVIIRPDCSTTMPGIFAAGDVTNAFGKRVILRSTLRIAASTVPRNVTPPLAQLAAQLNEVGVHHYALALMDGDDRVVLSDRRGKKAGDLSEAIVVASRDLSNLMSRTEESAPSERRFEIRRGALLVAADIKQHAKALGRVDRAVSGFLRDCGMTALKGIKCKSKALRAHCDRMDLVLRKE